MYLVGLSPESEKLEIDDDDDDDDDDETGSWAQPMQAK